MSLLNLDILNKTQQNSKQSSSSRITLKFCWTGLVVLLRIAGCWHASILQMFTMCVLMSPLAFGSQKKCNKVGYKTLWHSLNTHSMNPSFIWIQMNLFCLPKKSQDGGWGLQTMSEMLWPSKFFLRIHIKYFIAVFLCIPPRMITSRKSMSASNPIQIQFPKTKTKIRKMHQH